MRLCFLQHLLLAQREQGASGIHHRLLFCNAHLFQVAHRFLNSCSTAASFPHSLSDESPLLFHRSLPVQGVAPCNQYILYSQKLFGRSPLSSTPSASALP